MNRKLTPIASAVTLMMLGATMSVQAQQAAPAAPAADPAATETVIVVGTRASLQRSLDQKRNNSSHVEVVTADDIGKMPDKNVADTLSHVPGVTISSAGGTEGGFDEADRVSMRGTNPSLTLTTVNGHGVATGDWFVLDQAGSVGRSVSYTLIPSELVASVVVHKSSEASIIEGGVAGSIDIITRKPLDFKNQFTAEASIGAVYADLPGKTDPQFSGLINWKNDQKTFGILVQAFDEKRHLERQGQEMLSWQTIQPGTTAAKSNPDLIGVTYPGLLNDAYFTQERTRKGGDFDLQFKVSNDFSFDINGFASKLDAPNYNRSYEVWAARFLGGSGPNPIPGNGPAPTAYTVKNGVLSSATFAGVAGVPNGVYDMISRPNESETANFISIEGKLRVNSDLKFTAQIGTSKGDGKTPTQDVSEQNLAIGGGASWHLNGLGSAANWTLGSGGGTSVVSPSSTTFGWVFGDQNVDVKDTEDWAKIDGEYTIAQGNFTTLQFGARANSHERTSQNIVAQAPGCAGSPLTWSGTYNCGSSPGTASSYNLSLLGAPSYFPSGFGSGLGGSFPTNVWYYTPAQLAAYNSNSQRPTTGAREDWQNEFGVKETDTALYVQSNLEGNGWTGNVGLRYVQTKERSSYNTAEFGQVNPDGSTTLPPGVVTTSLYGNYLPTTVNHTYNNMLPSLNIKFDLTKELVARFAASKTLTRADYSALAGSVALGLPGTLFAPGTASGGNPDLKPIISNNVDATIEWYFGKNSLLSASLFEMDLTSYVGDQVTVKSYLNAGGNGVPAGTLSAYDLVTPVNIGANVKGIEFSFEKPLFKNFGIQANYTYVDASDSSGQPVVGASKNTGNLVGYYEDEHFNARLAYNYRSSFYSGVDRASALYQDSTAILSASLGYKFNDNLGVTLDGMNLNNPVLKYYGAAGESQPERFYINGRQYYLNLHLKY